MTRRKPRKSPLAGAGTWQGHRRPEFTAYSCEDDGLRRRIIVELFLRKSPKLSLNWKAACGNVIRKVRFSTTNTPTQVGMKNIYYLCVLRAVATINCGRKMKNQDTRPPRMKTSLLLLSFFLLHASASSLIVLSTAAHRQQVKNGIGPALAPYRLNWNSSRTAGTHKLKPAPWNSGSLS